MSNCSNSNHSELTKEEIDGAYKSIILMGYAETDLMNAETNMENGHFFRAMDQLREGKIHLQLGMQEYKEFIQILKDKKLWTR